PSAGLPPREPSRTGHHHYRAGDHEISRFSRLELVVRAWDLRPRRVHQRLANNAASSIAFRTHGKASAPRTSMEFRGSITPPARPLSTLRCALTERQRMTRGHRDSLRLRCRAFSSPSPCRFIPALSPAVHSDLSTLVAFAVADEYRAAVRVEVRLVEREGFAD